MIAGKVSEFDKDYLEELDETAKRLGVGDLVSFNINITEKQKTELLIEIRLLVVSAFACRRIQYSGYGSELLWHAGGSKFWCSKRYYRKL